MTDYFRLINANFIRTLRTKRRYLATTLLETALFLGILGATFVSAPHFFSPSMLSRDQLPGIVSRLVMITGVARMLQVSSSRINVETTMGTLEQIALAPFSLRSVLLADLPPAAASGLFGAARILFAATVIARIPVHMNTMAAAAIWSLTVVGSVGIGLITAGLVLVLKRLSAVTTIVEFAIMGIVFVPVEQLTHLRMIPAALGTNLMHNVFVEQANFASIAADLIFLAVESTLLLGFGLWAFGLLEQAARGRGTLGHY